MRESMHCQGITQLKIRLNTYLRLTNDNIFLLIKEYPSNFLGSCMECGKGRCYTMKVTLTITPLFTRKVGYLNRREFFMKVTRIYIFPFCFL